MKIHETIHTGEKAFGRQSTSLLFLQGFLSKMDGKFICPIQNAWEVYLSLPKWKGCALLPFCNNFLTPIAQMEWPWKKPYKIKIRHSYHQYENTRNYSHCLVKKSLVACIVTRLLRSITTFNFYVAGHFFIF